MPFAFSPIAFAVQGLIARIQEEQLQKVNGSGGRKLATTPPARERPEQDDDLIRQVIDKWEVIEAARAQDAASATERTEALDMAVAVSVGKATRAEPVTRPPAVPDDEANQLTEREWRRRHEQAVFMLLME